MRMKGQAGNWTSRTEPKLTFEAAWDPVPTGSTFEPATRDQRFQIPHSDDIPLQSHEFVWSQRKQDGGDEERGSPPQGGTRQSERRDSPTKLLLRDRIEVIGP